MAFKLIDLVCMIYGWGDDYYFVCMNIIHMIWRLCDICYYQQHMESWLIFD